MSRFKIYQIDHYDPESTGRKKRRLVAVYGILSFIFLLAFQVCVYALHIKFSLMLLTLGPLILGLYIYLPFRLRSDLNRIRIIGDIEFTRNSIKKRIGDSTNEYDFHSIERMELYRHLPSLTTLGSRRGYFSYILKIVFINSSSESLVISERPADLRQDLSIVETMKTLKKIIHPEIIIIT